MDRPDSRLSDYNIQKMKMHLDKLAFSCLLTASLSAYAASPGGIRGCSYWGEPRDTAVHVPSGISFYCVQRPEENGESVHWTADTKKGKIIMTDSRVADLRTKSYINFNSKTGKSSQISSYYNKRFDNDSLSIAFNRKVDSIPVKRNGTNSEVVLFDRVLRPSERMRVETYLAVRHNVTLTTSYISSRKDVVWDIQGQSEYSDCITGIAKDDSSALYKDTTDNSVLYFKCTSEIPDGHYLMVGANKGTSRFIKDGRDSCVYGKKWNVQATGGDFTVDAAFNVEEIKQIFPVSELKTLILDVDGVRYPADDYGHIKSVKFKQGANRVKLLSSDTRLAKKEMEESMFTHLQVYPNPSTDGNVRVQMEMAVPIAIELSLFDMNGRLVSQQHSAKDEYHDASVNLPYKGVFNLQLSTYKESKTIQLIRK